MDFRGSELLQAPILKDGLDTVDGGTVGSNGSIEKFEFSGASDWYA